MAKSKKGKMGGKAKKVYKNKKSFKKGFKKGAPKILMNKKFNKSKCRVRVILIAG
jgi:hypothetical protein